MFFPILKIQKFCLSSDLSIDDCSKKKLCILTVSLVFSDINLLCSEGYV